jgi:RecB family exonuclease
LASAVDWLLGRYRDGEQWDLSRVLIVTPGLRSRDRLLELMIERSEVLQLKMTPAAFAPLNQLPEKLYAPPGPFAGPVIEQVAWVRALRGCNLERLRILARNIPAVNETLEWLPLARQLRNLHVELAGEGVTFADVARELARLPLERDELKRWELLADAQQAYLGHLAEAKFEDRHAARIRAIQNCECRLASELILIGLVDLSRAVRAMLSQVADQTFALVFGDPSVAEGFDEFGGLIPDFWKTQPIDLADDQIRIAERPADQASLVIDFLSRLGGTIPAEQIAIGVPDRDVVPHVRRALDLASIPSRDEAGKRVTRTLPIRLAEAVIDYLRHRQFSQFAQILRHPDCFDWISERVGNRDWLQYVDDYQNQFIPGEFRLRDGFHLGTEERLHAVHRAVQELLQPLVGRARGLSQWTQAWLQLFSRIYGERVIDESSTGVHEALTGCMILAKSLRGLEELPRGWSIDGSAADAVEMVRDQIATESVAEVARAQGISLLGWLELGLDDAAVTIVTGMNEGFVPSAEPAQPFLPNSVRAQLGIVDSGRRYARDVYALSLLAHSPRQLTLICGRRGGDGDPLLPSRLLFAADDAGAARRTSAFFGHKPAASTPIWLAKGGAIPSAQQFQIPRPRSDESEVTSLSVTDFKQYLQCPYRFYLQRILRLQAQSDHLLDLPAHALGNLLHAIAEAFAKGPAQDSVDANEIREFFRGELDRHLETFGEHATAAVRIQHEQIRLRLDRLAELQAAWRADGWAIVEAELKHGSAQLIVDGRPFEISGRIDRVDRNEHTGELAVLDYKTWEPPDPPEKSHRRAGAWIDLQLPLYRHLIRSRDYFDSVPIKLGYILAPTDLRKSEFALASWTDEDLQSADEVALDVIRAVRRKVFWPPVYPPPYFGDSWAAICQDEVSERWAPGEVVEEAVG